MLKPVLKTCGRFALLTSLLAASASTAFAEWGEVSMELGPHDIMDTKAFHDMVVTLEAGGTPDNINNAITVHYEAPTEGYSARSVYMEITCYDPSIRGLPHTWGMSFPGHAISQGDSDEPGLFCPDNMVMSKAAAVVSLDSP